MAGLSGLSGLSGISGLMGGPYSRKVLNTQPGNLIAYWPLWEASGAVANDISGNGRNGTYTGVTLGQTGIGDGRTCPLFDGVNDYVNIYSASLAGAFDPTEGTLAGWFKVFNAGVWSDGITRRPMEIAADGNNQILVQVPVAANTLQFFFKSGGGTDLFTVATSTLDWIYLATTWSVAANEVRAFFNGVQSGAAQAIPGVWAGALAANLTVLGAGATTPGQVHHGYLAHAAMWDAPLTPTQIATLAIV